MDSSRPASKTFMPVVLVLLSLLSFIALSCSPSPSAPPTSITETTVSTTRLPTVVSYDDRAAFEAAAPDALRLVDFDTDAQGAAIVSDSAGVHADGYYKFYGIIFEAGVICGEPNLPFTGVSAPNTISNTGENTPTPALVDAFFLQPVYEVGITNTGGEVELRIFDEDDALVGSVRSDTDEGTKDFIGLISGIPIYRMEYDAVSGMSFEGDDLLFTEFVP